MLKILKFVPVQLVFFLVVGILISSNFNTTPVLLFGALVVLIFLLIVSFVWVNKNSKQTFLFNIITYGLVVIIGMTSFSSQTAYNHKNHYSSLSFQQDSINNISVVIIKILKSNQFNYRYEVDLQYLNSKRVKGKLLLNIKKDSVQKELNIDDYLFVKGVLEEVMGPKNPSDFNYKKYLKNQQIYHQLRIEKSDFTKLPNDKKTVKGYASLARKRINEALKESGFKANELAVINALFLGQRQTIDEELLENYVNAGAIHILAVSGLHIGIILLLLQFILRPLAILPRGKMIITIVSLFFLWLYAVLAGLSPSVVRAVTMFSALAIGMALNKPSNTYNSLFISMFILLLVHPFYVFEVGFQLSYLAVFSIVWLQPKISSLWKPKHKLVSYFWQLFAVSIAAQIGVGPLSVFYFHQFPGLFFVSNLVIIPFLGLVLISGIIIISFSLLNILPEIIAKGFTVIVQLMNGFVSFVGRQESFIFENLTFSLIVLIAIYIIIITFVIWTQTKKFKNQMLFLTVVVFVFMLNLFRKYDIETSNQFVVFHKNIASVVGVKKGNTSVFYSSEELEKEDYLVRNYLRVEQIKDISFSKEKKNLLRFDEIQILIIDKQGLYEFKSINPSIILLQNSPKINLDRVIKYYKPSLIIADGSNYKSFIKMWNKSCVETKTPFHSTLQKGAYILND